MPVVIRGHAPGIKRLDAMKFGFAGCKRGESVRGSCNEGHAVREDVWFHATEAKLSQVLSE